MSDPSQGLGRPARWVQAGLLVWLVLVGFGLFDVLTRAAEDRAVDAPAARYLLWALVTLGFLLEAFRGRPLRPRLLALSFGILAIVSMLWDKWATPGSWLPLALVCVFLLLYHCVRTARGLPYRTPGTWTVVAFALAVALCLTRGGVIDRWRLSRQGLPDPALAIATFRDAWNSGDTERVTSLAQFQARRRVGPFLRQSSERNEWGSALPTIVGHATPAPLRDPLLVEFTTVAGKLPVRFLLDVDTWEWSEVSLRAVGDWRP